MTYQEPNKAEYFWKADDQTYNELQKLIRFVRFVAGMEECSVEGKRKAEEIIEVIKNINEPEKIKHFNVCLGLKDLTFYDKNKDKGIYLREWNLWFECGFLEIRAASYQRDKPPPEPNEEHFYYHSYVSLKKDGEYNEDFKRVYLESDINDFVEDALNYKEYVMDTLNEIDLDIEVW